MSTESATQEPNTFTEALLGKELLASPLLVRFRAWPVEYRSTLVALMLGSLVLIPYLGAVGLWDPWETHYGEVAREMIQRGDYVHPYWENAWFFSKPAFTLWMQAFGLHLAQGGPMLAALLAALLMGGAAYLWAGPKTKASPTAEFWAGMQVWLGLWAAGLAIWGFSRHLPWKFADVASGDGALPLWTEWGFRMPFAAFSIGAVTVLTYAMTRVVNARAALATAVVLYTMPLYFLISRQAVTDTPIVASTIAGIACAMVALFDKESKHKAGWWYGAYVLFAIATLGKGLLGFGVPMVLFIFWFSLVRLEVPDWIKIVCVFVPPLGLVVAFGWELTKSRKWARAMLTGLAIALALGVVVGAIAAQHAAATRITFIDATSVSTSPLAQYFRAPFWFGLMWGSLAFWITATVVAHRAIRNVNEPPPGIARMAYEMRLGTGILLFLSVCLPWYYEMFTFSQVDDESKLFWYRFLIHDHFARLGAGVHTTTPGGDFTYFIEQGGYAMYPWVALIPAAIASVARVRIRGGDGRDAVTFIAALWFAITWALIGASATKFHHYVFPMLPPMAIMIGVAIDRLWEEGIDKHAAVLLFGVPLFFLVGKDLVNTPKNFTDLFVYNYDRPYPQMLMDAPTMGTTPLKTVMGYGFLLAGGLVGLFAVLRQKASMFAAALAACLVWAFWFNWGHWVDLSHHWTQRDQFWRYFSQRRPGEPIAAFLMNWRGETFYSRNTVKQIPVRDTAAVTKAYVAGPGRKWILVEHSRLGVLKSMIGAEKTVTLVDKDLNNKFVLLIVE